MYKQNAYGLKTSENIRNWRKKNEMKIEQSATDGSGTRDNLLFVAEEDGI